MEFKQTNDDTWEKRELTDTKQWRLVTKTGLTIEVKDPMSVPCRELNAQTKIESGFIPYFKCEPILSWGTGEEFRVGYYFNWFTCQWCEYYENTNFYKYFNQELAKLEAERQERERIREIDDLKERLQTLEDRVKELEQYCWRPK